MSPKVPVDLTMQMERQRQRQAFFDVVRAMALRQPLDQLPLTPHHERFVKGITDGAGLRAPAAVLFDEAAAAARSVLRQLSPFTAAAVPGAPVVSIGQAVGADFVSQTGIIPVLQLPIADTLAEVTKIAFLIAMDRRTVEESRRGRAAIERALLASTTSAEDAQLLSATPAVVGVRPAGLRVGAPVFSAGTNSAGDIAAAIGQAIAAVSNGAASALVAIATSGTAGALAASGAGPHDGTLGGVPLLIARSGPAGLVTFVDAALLAVVDDGITVDTSTQGAIDFAPPSSLVSLWQTNSVSLKVCDYIWWHVEPGAVAVADVGTAGS